MKWLYVTGRGSRGRLADWKRERERERWTVRARLAAWVMDWLAGLPSWSAAAERTEMHRSTEQTQTCHSRRLIQSVMIFPHLAALASFSSLHTGLCWTLLFFFLFIYLLFLTVCTTYRFMQQWKTKQLQQQADPAPWRCRDYSEKQTELKFKHVKMWSI